MTSAMVAMEGAFETALASIQTGALNMMTAAMPVALTILGVFIAVKLGIKFFKALV